MAWRRQSDSQFLKNEFKLHKEVDEKMAKIFLAAWADYRKDLAKTENVRKSPKKMHTTRHRFYVAKACGTAVPMPAPKPISDFRFLL